MSKTEEQWVELPQSDIAGFWDGEGTLAFRPQGFKSFKNKTFEGQKSVIIVGELIAGATAIDAETKEETSLEAGQTVGVWYSAGLRPLLTLKDARVRLKRDESLDKQIKKGQKPMKGYRFAVVGKPKRVPLDNLSDGGIPDLNPPSSDPEDLSGVPF